MSFGLFGMFNSSHKCKICKKVTKEILEQFDGPNWLCRNHLIEKFKKDFLAYSDKKVIFHAEPEKGCKT